MSSDVIYDLGIRARALMTMKGGDARVIENACIGIQGSKIAAVVECASGNECRSNPPFKAKRWIDGSQHIVMPGLVNGHTHFPMTLFRGLADDLPFDQWLHGTILPLEGKLLDPDFVRTGSQLAALESIRFGVTTVCDMYMFEDEVARVIDESGMRGIVCECFVDFPAPDDPKKDGSAERILRKMVAKYGSHERVTPAVGPHAPYTCGDDLLRKMRALADELDIPICSHVSETESEVAESLKKYGKTPIERYHALGVTGKRTIFAHCIHLTDADMKIMAESGTSAIYNPESNMKLGSGIARVPEMVRAGIKVGLGTDGAASNNSLNLFTEMDSGAKLQKLSHKDNTAMTAPDALRLATLSGARALGLDHQIGSIEVGKLADIILVRMDVPHMQPIHDYASQLVYAATGTEVDTVLCHGNVLYERGEFKTLDAGRIYADAERVRDRIRERL